MLKITKKTLLVQIIDNIIYIYDFFHFSSFLKFANNFFLSIVPGETDPGAGPREAERGASELCRQDLSPPEPEFKAIQ